MSTDTEPWEIYIYLDCPYNVAEALFDQMCDLACDCTDDFGRCVYCGQEHPRDEEGEPIPCDQVKPCRSPISSLGPVRSDEEMLRVFGTEQLEAELARRAR